MVKNICIYSDEGVGAFSAFAARHYFNHKNEPYEITPVNAAKIIQNGFQKDTDLFIMPGGADRPYAKKLKGAGNQAIREYVENGGTYLGICAGAYYGCQHIEFQKNSPHEICETRELGFFNGVGIGCLPELTHHCYDETLQSANVTTIKINDRNFTCLYWGGCMFVPHSETAHEVIATYQDIDGQPPAIISCAVGSGKAILSGVHFEVNAQSLMAYDFDENNDLTFNLSAQIISPFELTHFEALL